MVILERDCDIRESLDFCNPLCLDTLYCKTTWNIRPLNLVRKGSRLDFIPHDLYDHI